MNFSGNRLGILFPALYEIYYKIYADFPKSQSWGCHVHINGFFTNLVTKVTSLMTTWLLFQLDFPVNIKGGCCLVSSGHYCHMAGGLWKCMDF